MIRFALTAASVLGFMLTAALGNLLYPISGLFKPSAQSERAEPPPTSPDNERYSEPKSIDPKQALGGFCLALGVLAAAGMGWFAACVSQPELAGSGLTARLLAALCGALIFGAVGLADDVVRLRTRSALGLRRAPRLALEVCAACLALALMRASGAYTSSLILPGGICAELGSFSAVLWIVMLVALAECSRAADGADGTVCGAAFAAMLGLMFVLTVLGQFPLAVLPAAAAGASMALLLWNFPPAKLHPGTGGCLFLTGLVGCIPLSVSRPELAAPLALPFWLEGCMTAAQILYHRLSRGKLLFSIAPLHAWLKKRGVGAVGVFCVMCAFSALGSALTVRLALLS